MTTPSPNNSQGNGETTSYAYDNLGNLLSQTDAMGKTTSYVYNSRNQCVSQTDPDGGVTLFTYDLAGNMLSTTDPDGNVTVWSYDALNRASAETEFYGTSSAATASYAYDLDGHLVQSTDYDGRVIQYVYDNLGRETHENWISGQTVVKSMSFYYDATGELTGASDPASANYLFSYDDDGNNTSSTAAYAGLTADGTTPNLTLKKAYDPNGYLTDLYAYVGDTADFHNSYTYDQDGNVMSITQQADTDNAGDYPGCNSYNPVSGKHVSFSYDGDGRTLGVSSYAVISGSNYLVATSAYAYDGDGNLTSLTETDGLNNTLGSYTWSYDADNRVTQFSSSYWDNLMADGTASYGYDYASQLTSVSYSSPPPGVTSPESYSYDAAGNRTNSGYSTGVGNRLLSDGTYTYTYDADGNELTRTQISSASSDQYEAVSTWDYRNRLTEITYKNNSGATTETIQYTYDVFNRRIGEHVHYTSGNQSDMTLWSVYDGQQVVLELNSDAMVAERYLPGPAVDQVLAEETAANIVSWLLADTRGTVRDVVQFSYDPNTNSGATYLFDHLEYGGYGQTIYESHPSDNPGFCYDGQYWDSYAGSYCCEARWYNPSTGRYESEDPTGFSAGDANLYRYVFNDPANSVDPTGEQVCWIVPMLAVGANPSAGGGFGGGASGGHGASGSWGENTPSAPGAAQPTTPGGGGWGAGVVGGGQIEGGLIAGSSAQYSKGVGYFSNDGFGKFTSGGAYAGSPHGGCSAVQNPNPAAPNNPGTVNGASAGVGAQVFVTNTGNLDGGITGPFTTVNWSYGLYGGQIASAPGPNGPTWFVSLGIARGWGWSISAYPTTTHAGWGW